MKFGCFKTIFLDMDGLVSNFIKGAARVFNEDYEELMERWIPGNFDMEIILGISTDEFFNKISEQGSDFWYNLEPYPYYRELIDFCKNKAPVYFLTSPTRDPSCAKGKIKWLQKYVPELSRNFLITTHKHFCANENTVLIDDHEKNVDKFVQHGGKAILFPTLWNKRYAERGNALEICKEELEKHYALQN